MSGGRQEDSLYNTDILYREKILPVLNISNNSTCDYIKKNMYRNSSISPNPLIIRTPLIICDNNFRIKSNKSNIFVFATFFLGKSAIVELLLSLDRHSCICFLIIRVTT